MKKSLFLVALLGIAAVGCSSPNKYQGTPPMEYGTEVGQGHNAPMDTNAPSYPNSHFNQWQYRGITPNTP